MFDEAESMTTFILMLILETQERLLERLNEEFRSMSSLPAAQTTQNLKTRSSLLIAKPGRLSSKIRLEVFTAKEVFQRLLSNLQDWKPL